MFASKAIQARRIKEHSNVITIIHDTVSAAIRYAFKARVYIYKQPFLTR